MVKKMDLVHGGPAGPYDRHKWVKPSLNALINAHLANGPWKKKFELYFPY